MDPIATTRCASSGSRCGPLRPSRLSRRHAHPQATAHSTCEAMHKHTRHSISHCPSHRGSRSPSAADDASMITLAWEGGSPHRRAAWAVLARGGGRRGGRHRGASLLWDTWEHMHALHVHFCTVRIAVPTLHCTSLAMHMCHLINERTHVGTCKSRRSTVMLTEKRTSDANLLGCKTNRNHKCPKPQFGQQRNP